MKKIIFLSWFLLVFAISPSEAVALDELVKDAESAILIEASTGQVLYEKNSNMKLEPASMTKMMTMNLILNAKDNDVINFSESHIISEYAASMGGSQIFLEEGEIMKIDDLFKSIAIVSANDSAVALAERIGGSESNFVKMMNDEITKMGLKNTNFTNATGLPDDKHVSTAYDMAMIGRELLKHGDSILDYTSIYEDYIRNGETWLVNTNKLVKFVEGVDGLKTGWTDEAGYCLTATMNLNGIRVIAVLMGSSNSADRNLEITQLMQYGVSNYEVRNILKKDEVFDTLSSIRLEGGTYEVKASEDVNYVIKKGNDLKNVSYNINFNDKIDGLNYGTIDVLYDGNVYKTIDLVLDREVKEATFLQLFISIIKTIIV